ncbi:MAG: hypothetical protein IJN94_07800 [Clostridia bacterium]|nr:hypothetical protein [Clostridia bacterium]
MRKIISIFLILSLLVAFCSCGDNKNGDETTTGESYVLPTPVIASNISLPYTSAADFNPYKTKSSLNRDLLPIMYESLYIATDNGKGEPQLASNGEIDGKTVTVKILQGLKFSDGGEFISSHVKYSYEKAKSSSYYKAQLSNISSITLIDNYTIKFTLRNADPMALNALDFPITKGGDGEYVGTGKYTLGKSGDMVYFQVNKNHRDYNNSWNEQIALYDMAGVSSPIYPFKANKISIYRNDLNSSEYINLSSKTVSVGLDNLVYVGVNSQWAGTVTSIDWVRQAVNIGIDRNIIASSSYLGQGTATVTPFKKGYYELEKMELIGESGNLEKAINILERHGYDKFNGDKVRTNGSASLRVDILVCTENPYKLTVAENFKAQLEKLGFGVKIRKYEKSEDYILALEEGHYSFYIGEARLTNNCDLSEFFSTDGKLNYGINEEIFEIYSMLRSGESSTKVFVENFSANVPFLPLFYRKAVVSVNPNITGVGEGNSLYSSVSDWKMPKEQ